MLSLREYLLEDEWIFAPVFMDLHAKSEEYFFIEDLFEHDTRLHTDGLDFFSSLSDDDDFL